MPSPQVSIIVPSRNKAGLIAKTLESIRAQDMANFEAFVIDNGSSDGSQKIIEEFAAKDKRFAFIQNPGDKGLVYSLNLGLSKAGGKYIAVFHCDDIWAPNFLSSSIALFEKNPSAGICFCRYENIDEEGKTHKILARNQLEGEARLVPSAELFSLLLSRDFMPVCTVLASRQAHEKCGGYDPQYPGPCDYQMWLKIAYKLDGIYNSKTTSKYRIYGENDSNIMIDQNVILLEQYSMILKLFSRYIPPSPEAQRQKNTMLRNTSLSALRQAINSIAQGKGSISRSKCGIAVMVYPGIIEHILAFAIYFTSLFTFILSPIFKLLIPAILPILKKLKLY